MKHPMRAWAFPVFELFDQLDWAYRRTINREKDKLDYSHSQYF